MEKKVILITGTSSGFGWLAATSCAALGHKVYATMRDTKGRNADKAKALGQQANIEILDVEVTDERSVRDAVETIIKKEGRMDVVVNNAGVYATGIAETFTADDLDKVMDVDVKGPWRIIRAALPQMRRQGEGLIINISSVAGRFSFPFQMAYNTAKFAIEGLTEGLHYEVRSLGVDVVVIQPGPFPTDIFGKMLTGSDATVIAGYGDLAKVPEQIGAGIGQLFETLKPNPQLVADAIVKLINTPTGKRPLRTVVDPATGNFSEIANKHVKEQYENFLTAFGLQGLLSNPQDFTATIEVDQTPKEAFNAINNVRGWWSEEIEGSTDKLNDEFKYHFEDIHRCQIKVIEVIADRKIVWLVMDNYFKPGIFDEASHHLQSNDRLTKDQSEWTGTKISFEIAKKDDKTQIRFTHLGLVPAYECFDVCSNAWNHYIRKSLLSLITTGKGQPNSTGRPMTTDEEKFHSA